MPCFVSGTLISTDHGEVNVEDLRPGDTVRTMISGASQTITWAGRRTVDCQRHPQPAAVWPVRVQAHAFGRGLPQRDLWLSPDHAVYVDGSLIPVKYLINGKTIAQVPVDRVTYHHIELERHDVVLSEGLPTESYLEVCDRDRFSNGGVVATLHPDFSTPAYPDLLALIWEAEGCAPLVMTGPALVAARKLIRANLPKAKVPQARKPRRRPV